MCSDCPISKLIDAFNSSQNDCSNGVLIITIQSLNCTPLLLSQIFRKAALKLVEPKDPSITSIAVSTDNLKDFVGNPIFTSDRMYETTPPGVVMGLAWTAMGGSTLYIETALTTPPRTAAQSDGREGSDGGRLLSTGQLGDVMKESTEIAYTYAKVYISIQLVYNYERDIFLYL